jgi:hypothetical protein
VVPEAARVTVETRWPIEFDADQIERLEAESFRRILARPSGRRDWAAALEEARSLVTPAAAWELHPVRQVLHDSVVLEGGARLGGGPLASVVGGAAELLVAVCTVGAAISARVRELQGEGQMLRGLLLDDLGSWGVDRVRQQLCRRLEEEAEAAGLRVSTCLSPGESDWPITEQRVLFTLVDAASIGVSLSTSLVMSPLKSLSMVMGRGSGPMGHEGGSNCDFCAIRDRCGYRDRRAVANIRPEAARKDEG